MPAFKQAITDTIQVLTPVSGKRATGRKSDVCQVVTNYRTARSKPSCATLSGAWLSCERRLTTWYDRERFGHAVAISRIARCFTFRPVRGKN